MTSHGEAGDLGPWAGAASVLLSPPDAPEVGKTVGCREGDRDVLVSEVFFPAAPYKGQPSRAFGYWARPRSESGDRFPAMLLIHGGGGTADPRWARWWARRGYAALAIDLGGMGPERQPLPNGGPVFSPETFQLTHGLENTWMYHAVATSLAAVSALEVLPSVAPDRIGVTGVSWGGYFCATVMSLDTRLKLGVPVFGCGFNPRVANGADPAFTDGKIQRDAFDPSNFLSCCHKPVLWVTTTSDTSAPPDELEKSVRLTPGPSTLCLTVNPGHVEPKAIGLGQRSEIEYFVDSVFRDSAEPLLRLGDTILEGYTLRAPVIPNGAPPVSWASLHYTHDLGKPWPQRQWQSVRAKDSDGMVTATLPPDAQGKPLVAFVNVCDDRDAVVASSLCQIPA